MLPRKRITPNKWTTLNASKDIGLASRPDLCSNVIRSFNCERRNLVIVKIEDMKSSAGGGVNLVTVKIL